MDSHGYWRRQMKRYLAGELTEPAQAALRQHAGSCEACAGLIDTAATLRAANLETLSQADSVAIRSGVLRQLQRRPRPSVHLAKRTADTNAALRLRSLVTAAVGLALLAGGFVAGRTWTAGGRGTTALVEDIERVALRNRTLADVESSPYVVSGVSLETVDTLRVIASFDVTSHVTVTADRASPLVRELVVQAVLNPGGVGSRLKAIDYAAGLRSDQVRDALRAAMLDDPSVAVRLRALTALSVYKDDPSVQAAFLGVLTTSDSVQMRLLAIDYLVENRVDPAAMREALRQLDPTTHAASLLKARAYLP